MANKQATTPRYWFIKFTIYSQTKGIETGVTWFEYNNTMPPAWFCQKKAATEATQLSGETVAPAQVRITGWQEFKSQADYNSFVSVQPSNPLM